MDQQAYDSLSASEQQAYDLNQRKKEAEEQAALPYTWTQDLDHASMTYSIPGSETIRAKQLDVSIKRSGLKVSRKDTKETLLEGTFPKEVKVDDCTWSLGEFCWSASFEMKLIKLHGTRICRGWENPLHPPGKGSISIMVASRLHTSS